MKCPNCGNDTQDDAIFCDHCGMRLDAAAEPAAAPAPATAAPAAPAPTPAPALASATTTAAPEASAGSVCPSCGASNTPGELFCSECGDPLAPPAPEAAAVQPAVVEPAAPVAAPAPAPAPAPEPAAEVPAMPAMPAEAAPAPVATAATCPVCGVDVQPGDAFCFACGADITGAASEPAAAPEPAPAAPAEAAAPAPAAPAASAPAEAKPRAADECPACGAKVGPDDAFCDFCGAALVAAAPAGAAAPVAASAPAPQPAPTPAPTPPAPAPAPAPVAAPAPAPAGARLVVKDSGIEFPLTATETIVGREDAYGGIFPDVDLTPHGGEAGGVSRRHFRVLSRGGQFTIEDLNSTNFTIINHQRLQAGSPVALTDGDEIRAGRVRLIFRMG